MIKITHLSVNFVINKIMYLLKPSSRIVLLGFIYSFTFVSAYAQEVPFTVRYQNTFKGNIKYVANNVLSADATNALLQCVPNHATKIKLN